VPLYHALAVLLCCLAALARSHAPLDELSRALSANDTKAAHAAEEHLLAGNQSLDVLLNAGALLAQHDMLADAALVFKTCAKRFPNSFDAKYNLALAHIGVREDLAAEITLQAMSSDSPRETTAAEYLHGKVYSATGRKPQARQSFENAYRAYPADENYALDLALLYLQSSAYVPAIHVLQAARAAHPESSELAIELALSEALSGQSAAAISVSEEMLQRDPSQPAPHLVAAFAQCFAGNFQACESEAAAGLTLPGANPYLHYLHAEALWNSHSTDNEKLLADLNIAIEKMPQCGVCLLLRSKVLDAVHHDSAAIADLKTALAQDPQLAQAWYLLSMLYRKTGQTAEASAAIQRYRALHDAQENSEIESFRKQFIDK
jgi:predicted Zn-dependent protease